MKSTREWQLCHISAIRYFRKYASPRQFFGKQSVEWSWKRVCHWRPAVQVSDKSKQVHIQQKNRKETEVFLPVFDLFKDLMRLSGPKGAGELKSH
ncbi:hypothetical protein AK95_07225 [Paenibacillus sp. LC231]|uniref:hypothetical protein n=1 Tax=Paenibacillus sp. LC231 TaxID=1120679 RepID=UPI0008DE0E4F|nr:hypothetical protein [Paenibacillus sp. LC231]OIB03393.1 hypothetical protein AK95_07225 [Paenibacillus sp. LC231]